MSSDDIAVLHRDPTFVVCARGPLLATLWWDAPTMPQMMAFERHAAAHTKSSGGATALAQFVVDGIPRFANDVRRQAEHLTREYFDVGIAHVIEMEGLKGAAVRAFLSSLILISRDSKPVKVFSKAEDAATWIATQLRAVDASWTTEDVIAVRTRGVEARPAM